MEANCLTGTQCNKTKSRRFQIIIFSSQSVCFLCICLRLDGHTDGGACAHPLMRSPLAR